MASINEDKKQDSIASKLENADEKVGTIVVENVNGDAAPREVQAADGDDALRLVGTHAHQFDEAYYKRLRLKIDLHIMPLLCFIYFTQFTDKNILSYSSIMGFPVKGIQYNTVAQAFYVGYLVWMFPAQYIGQRFPIAKYLGVNIILWGCLVMLTAVCKNFSGFYALRFFLGTLEACVAPCLILIVSMWYKQNERASRIAWFYVGNLLSSVVGGASSYGITFYHGQIASWQLLYIVLGALAIVCGLLVIFYLPSSAATARFLSDEEKIAALERIRLDQGGTHNKHIKKYQIREAFTDIRTWIMALIILCLGIPNGGNSAFNNLIQEGLGFSERTTLLLDMPRAAIGGVAVVGVGWLSDRYKDRMSLVLLTSLPTLIGMIILTTMQNSGKKGVLEFGLLIQNLSAPTFPLCYAWNSSNTGGYTKKNTINAFTLFTFGVGSVVGTYIFLPQDAPGYIPGKAAIGILTGVLMCAAAIMAYINVRWNRQKKVALQQLILDNGWSEEEVQHQAEKAAFLDLTDKENVFFTYTR
ncbi:MFS general substrate transporter [Neohortaea acidophila]|uniref:MFS general substrate transporter n=1 Tax=Neohortaea acidophila TaxID=245834 RepID=A0A6A6Q1R2_9PEZI|nr:MFS general substrate transporter [Neohortaea acidophila]KAF2486222.1 MFS general substrate transporter [Neohortaea acidophila]